MFLNVFHHFLIYLEIGLILMRLVYHDEEPDAIRKSGPTGPDFRSSKPGLPRVPLLQQQAERELSQCCFKLTLPLLKRLKRMLGIITSQARNPNTERS